MADEQEYEVEIVDDQSAYVDDSAQEDTASPEGKATEQAQAEQDSGAQPLSGKQRRSKLKERIDELTRKYRDEERNRYTIERERDDEREQFQQHQRSFQQEQENSARIVFSTLKDNKQLLESHLETARNKGDTKTENQIQDKLTEVRESMGRLKQYYPRAESGDAQGEQAQGTGRMQPQGQPRTAQTQEPATQQPQQPKIPDAAKQWIDSNSWLKERADLHATINAFDAALKAQGKDPATPEFYVELTKKLKSELPDDLGKKLASADNDDLDDLLGPDDDDEDDDDQPDAAAQARKEQRPANSGVSEGGRAAPRGTGKRKVKLSRDEQAMAQRLGISNEAYAKQKVRSESNTGYQYID